MTVAELKQALLNHHSYSSIVIRDFTPLLDALLESMEEDICDHCTDRLYHAVRHLNVVRISGVEPLPSHGSVLLEVQVDN